MWLGKTSQLALRAVLHIAQRGGDAPVSIDEIARALDTPRNYLSKTLHQLVLTGVLRSRRGRHGGFQLAEPADTLTVACVVAPFASSQPRRCLLGRAECGGPEPCAAHERWKHVADAIERFFEDSTVARLLRDEAQASLLTRSSTTARRRADRRAVSKR